MLSSSSQEVLAVIRGDDLTVGLVRIPTECYVLIQSDDTIRRTKTRLVTPGEVTEWDDLILL